MMTNKGLRTANSSNPVTSVAIFISEHSCSTAALKAPTNNVIKPRLPKLDYFLQTIEKEKKLDSLSSHVDFFFQSR